MLYFCCEMQYENYIDFSGKDIFVTILLFIYGTAWLIQMIYYFVFYMRFAYSKQKIIKNEQYPPVSVVIAARNEYINLSNNLRSILEQDYPDFEVIVVDDNSDDDTQELLKSFSREYSNFKNIPLSSSLRGTNGKKFPLSIGIKSASNEILLLTDADCRPASVNWIKKMTSVLSGKTKIVLGYGAYEKRRGLLNKLIRWDTLNIAMEYFSFAMAGFPYMGVGRNLAYKKSLFTSGNGFASHYMLNSGDDDLFVNQHARKNNTSVCIDSESFTYSVPALTFSGWIRQKRRHITSGNQYKFKHKLLLGIRIFSQEIFWISLITLLCMNNNILPTISLLILRLLTQLIVIKKSTQKFHEKNLLLFSPIFELFFIIFYPTLILINIFKKENKWK